MGGRSMDSRAYTSEKKTKELSGRRREEGSFQHPTSIYASFGRVAIELLLGRLASSHWRGYERDYYRDMEQRGVYT